MHENVSPTSSEERQPSEEQAEQAAAQDALDQQPPDDHAADNEPLDQQPLGPDTVAHDSAPASERDMDAAGGERTPPGDMETVSSTHAAGSAAPTAAAEAPTLELPEMPPEASGEPPGEELSAEPSALPAAQNNDMPETPTNDGQDTVLPVPDEPAAAVPPAAEVAGEAIPPPPAVSLSPESAPHWPLSEYHPGYGSPSAGTHGPSATLEVREGLTFVPWTLRQTLTGTALTLIPWLIFAIAAQVAAAGVKQPTPAHRLSPAADLVSAVVVFIISAVLEAIFLIAPLIYAARTAPPDLHGSARLRAMLGALGLRRPRVTLGQAAVAVGGAIAVILLASYAYDIIVQRLHLPLKTNADTLLNQAKYEPMTVIATLLVAVLVAPICEELFFRGYLFPGLARGMATWGAVVGSALLFGLAHADIGSFVVLVVIGAALAVVRWRTDSLWPGVVVHTLNNAIALVGILVLLHQ